MGLSRRQYAAHRGVSHTAVNKAVKSGRITPELDGTIDPAKADMQWANRTDPAKQREADSGKMDQAKGSDLFAGDEKVSFQRARLAHEVVKTRTANVRLLKMKGELIDKRQAESLVFRLAREERDAWVTWPSRVAALIAADLDKDAGMIQRVLEAHVRSHLEELGSINVKIK